VVAGTDAALVAMVSEGGGVSRRWLVDFAFDRARYVRGALAA
jgi:hypothetical protein